MAKAVYTETHQRQFRRVIPDLIRAREVLWDLVWKDFRIRYRYAVMGFMWAILEPLLLCLVLTFVFSFVFQLRNLDPSIESRWDFAALLLCALIPWQFFSHSMVTATNSLIDHRDLVSKVYFPREIIPLASVGIAIVNFGFAFVVLVALVSLFGHVPGAAFLWVIPLFALQCVLVCGLALFFSCLNAHYRDVKYMVEVGVVFAFYATPIFYTLNTVKMAVNERLPEEFAWVYYLYLANPMAGFVTAYREVLVYNRAPDLGLIAWPAVAAVTALVVGAYVFRRRAGLLADYL